MADFVIPIIAAVATGVLIPVILAYVKDWRWAQPRKKLLLQMLTGELPFRSLRQLTLVTGTSDDDCRTLLIAINARGAMLKDNVEGWALISRKPLNMKINDIEKQSVGDK